MGFGAADEDFAQPATVQVGEDLRAAAGAKVSFDGIDPSRWASSATVGPKPFGYCSVATTGRPRVFAASIKRRTFQATRRPSAIAGSSFSCTSMTSRAVSSRPINSGLRGNRASLFIGGSISRSQREGNIPGRRQQLTAASATPTIWVLPSPSAGLTSMHWGIPCRTFCFSPHRSREWKSGSV